MTFPRFDGGRVEFPPTSDLELPPLSELSSPAAVNHRRLLVTLESDNEARIWTALLFKRFLWRLVVSIEEEGCLNSYLISRSI